MKLILKENKYHPPTNKVLMKGEEAPPEWKGKPFVEEVVEVIPAERKEVRTVIESKKKGKAKK